MLFPDVKEGDEVVVTYRFSPAHSPEYQRSSVERVTPHTLWVSGNQYNRKDGSLRAADKRLLRVVPANEPDAVAYFVERQRTRRITVAMNALWNAAPHVQDQVFALLKVP